VDVRGARIAMLFVLLVAAPALARAQPKRAMVLDQTNLPLPGVRLDVYRGDQVIQTTVTGADGTFELPPGPATDMVEAALEGFETTRVPRSAADRIVLALAHASEVTEVVASALTSSGSSMEHLGSTMTAPLAQRLPAVRPRILQSLPLLPSVVRGRDDLTAFKTFDLFSRKMDLGLQVFNLTNHFNPRDVIAVVQSPRFGELTNNPGVTLGGYMGSVSV
jgi:hypothetical protein